MTRAMPIFSESTPGGPSAAAVPAAAAGPAGANRAVPRILIIAGSDSGGGAGIQADIKTVTMLGGHAMTAITAITAQNSLTVTGVLAVPAAMVIEQIDAVAADLGIDAVKIGMIGSPETAAAVAERLLSLGASPPRPGAADLPIVFDPVMVASSGSVLADSATVAAFERLMKAATLTTPNAPELAALTGLAVATVEQLELAAVELARRTGCAVLAKGGHLAGDSLIDLLVDAAGEVTRFVGPRIASRHTHGTGCTLASGIACGLGRGLVLADAVRRGRDFTRAALAAAPGFGAGHGPMGHALGVVPFDSLSVRG
jgi:hydroxymethylpyrimidine/phosphomethylpyrimidine kinase